MCIGLTKESDLNRIKDLEAEVAYLKFQLEESRRLENSRLTSEEELRELSLNLSLAQNDAEARLHESQTLLNGLQHLYKAVDGEELFRGILSILGKVLDFEEAFLAMGDSNRGFVTFESSFKQGFPEEWGELAYFTRIIEKNKPAAIFDVTKSPALSFLADNPLIDIKSLLLIPLPENSSRVINQSRGLLVCTHSTKGFFGKKHTALGSRFGVLAAQAVYNHLLLSELNVEKAKLEERVLARTREIETLARFPDENPNGVIRFDTKRHIQYANAEGSRFLSLIGSDASRLSTQWDPIISKALKDQSLQEIQIKQEDCVFVCHLSPIISENYFNLYTQDITEKFEAQRAQLRSERRLSIIFENAQDAIVETDEFGTILVWNKQAELIFGWRSAEVIGMPFVDLVVASEDYLAENKWNELSEFSSMEPFINKRVEIEGKHRNKSIFSMEISVTPIVIDDETIYSVFMRDITESKKVLDELNKARIEAETAVKAKSHFLANMSHEIRTPLNSIIGMSQLLTKTELNQQQVGFSKIIEQNGDTLLSLINDLLNFSKLESDGVELETVEFKISDLVEQSIDVVSSEAAKKKIKLQATVSPNIPGLLYGDFGKLQQILVNLLSNAVKFTPEGCVYLNVLGKKLPDYTYSGESPNRSRMIIEFVVKDTGIGIENDKLADLFSPFNQVDPSITRIYGGTGLGLSICKELVQLMNGAITVESEINEGTTFQVEIPIHISDEKLFGLNQNQFLFLAEKNILILTPNEYDKVLLTQQLILMDMIPHALESVEEGLHLIKNGIKLDAVILGVSYYSSELIKITKEIREAAQDEALPIIVLKELWQSLRIKNDEGRVYPINKPIKSADLFSTLDLILSQSEKGSESGKEPACSSVDAGQKLGIDYPLSILVVEDNRSNRIVAENILAYFGYTAEFVENGELALEQVKEKEFDLIFMDIQMPVMDGITATKIIRNQLGLEKQPKIFALTANVMERDLETYIKIGMDGHVCKPIILEDIGQVLITAGEEAQRQERASGDLAGDFSSLQRSKVKANSRQGLLEAIDLERYQKSMGALDAFTILNQIFPAYEIDFQTYFGRIEIGIQQENIDMIKSAVHALKGCAGSIGAYHLADLCRLLEKWNFEEEFGRSSDILTKIKDEHSAVCNAWEIIVTQKSKEN